jgi:hypothetical protein
MNIPKRISAILRQKQDFIDKNRAILEKSVIDAQIKLFDELIAQIIPSLDIVDGKITESLHNYRVLGDLDKVYKRVNEVNAVFISNQIIGTTAGLVELGRNYFAVALTDDLGSRFDKVVLSAAKKMDLRIGVEGGKMVRGGFLESVVKDPTLSTEIKKFMSKTITGQSDTKDFISGLSSLVNGKDGPGTMEKQYQRLAYDLYQQYDAAYNSSLSDEFGMNYFIYQGGLITDSRDFCAAHNNKVFHRSETEDWYNWTPSQGEYPAGYQVKSKNIYEVPSYIDYPGYQPLIDRGGYNCRHMIGWISDNLAFSLRPDLELLIK